LEFGKTQVVVPSISMNSVKIELEGWAVQSSGDIDKQKLTLKFKTKIKIISPGKFQTIIDGKKTIQS